MEWLFFIIKTQDFI